MPKFGLIMGILLVAIGLSGCGFCPKPDGLTEASKYQMRSSLGSDGKYEARYVLPPDTWAANPEVTAFLRKVVEQEGRSALVSSYGFHCKAAPTSDCPDCSSCTRTMHRVRDNPFSFIGCVDDGVMRFQVDVGPGSTVRAMTYWKE